MWHWRKEWSTKENNAELQWNHEVSIGAAVVGERARLGMKQRQTVQNKAHNLGRYQVTLV